MLHYAFSGCVSLVDCELGGTLYKSGVDLRPCAKLSARSLYTWVDALYDWTSNPEEKTTDDTDHTLYLTDAQQTTLQDYTEITLPRRIRWRNIAKNPIRRGDDVRISLGYDGRDHLAFVGTVSRVSPGTPMTIEAQDPMAAFQTQTARRLAYTSVTLDRLLADQGIEAEIKGGQSIGAYRVECDTVSELLDALKKQGIRSMMRIGAGSEPRMYAGLAMSPADARTFALDDHANVASRAELRYEPADGKRFLVRVVNHSTAQGGKRSRSQSATEAGSSGGELRTFNVVGMTDAEARAYADEQLARLRQGGLSGSITVFGGEIIDKLDALSLTLDGNPAGTWQVERNDISWGEGGFRQRLTLGTRLSG